MWSRPSARLHPGEPARDPREPGVELGQPFLGVYAVPSGRRTIFARTAQLISGYLHNESGLPC
jgi:hypothetical protein